jgi:hypothetical protein
MLSGFDAQRNILQRRAIATHNRNIFKFQQRRHALVYRQQHQPRNRSVAGANLRNGPFFLAVQKMSRTSLPRFVGWYGFYKYDANCATANPAHRLPLARSRKAAVPLALSREKTLRVTTPTHGQVVARLGFTITFALFETGEAVFQVNTS